MHEQVDKSPTDTLADLIAKANADLMMKQETFILHFFDGLENFKRYHQNYHFIFAPVEWIEDMDEGKYQFRQTITIRRKGLDEI